MPKERSAVPLTAQERGWALGCVVWEALVLSDATLMVLAADDERDAPRQRIARDAIYLKSRNLIEFFNEEPSRDYLRVQDFGMAREPFSKGGAFQIFNLFLHQRSMHLSKRRLVEKLDSIYDRTRKAGKSSPGEAPGIHLRSFALAVLDKTMNFIGDQLENRGVELSKREHVQYLVSLRDQYKRLCEERERWRRERKVGFAPVSW